MLSYDAIVVGLGAMGSAALDHLAGRGLRVLGLDRWAPPHDRGSTHGETRMTRQAYYEDPAYVPLLARAYTLWEELQADAAAPLLRLTGGLMIGRPGAQVVEGSLRSARAHGLPHEMLDAAELCRRFPALRAAGGEVALFEPRAGVLFPERCVEAMLARAGRRGAEIRCGERVVGWRATSGRVEVETAGERYAAGRLVLAAGAWTPELLRLPLPLAVERQVMWWFEPGEGTADLPVFFWERQLGRPLCYFPAIGGLGCKVMFHHGGAICTPETIDRDVEPAEEAEIRAALAACVPGLDGGRTDVRTCMYTNTPDRHFVLGLHPLHPEVVIAAGFSGHGFKFAPVVGEVLADLICAGRTRHPVGLFDPGRFAVDPSS